MANEIMTFDSGSGNDHWRSTDGGYEGVNTVGVGYISYLYGENRKMRGAIRFPSVTVPAGGCNYAGLYIWTQYNGKNDDYPRSGNWNFRVWGIDEDNAGNFSSGSPFGRSLTTAYDDSNNGDEPDEDTWKEVNVTSSVNEIMSRAGWSSGNAIALVMEPTEVASNKYSVDEGDFKYFLLVRSSAEPNFTPTAKSVSAPTFPAIDDFGIKISYPKYDVLTATDEQCLMTTRKKVFKKVIEGDITTTANVVSTIAHGQSYIPFATAYAQEIGSSRRYKMPRYLAQSLYQDQFPDLDTTNGTIEVDSTNVRILTTSNCSVHYRIFLDQVE